MQKPTDSDRERPPDRASSQSILLTGLLITAVVGIGVVAFRFSPSSAPDSAEPKQKRELVTADEKAPIDYVGAEACRECHRERVEEFVTTNHFRTSRKPVVSEWVKRVAGGANAFHTRDPDLSFEMSIDNGRLIQTSITKTGVDKERRQESVGLVYGAGTVDEVFHFWKQDRLYQMPVAYLNPLKQWGNSPGFMDGTANWSREITPRCVECHNTWFDHVPGTVNQFHREHAVPGVSCERCHGPGREHVEFHKSNPAATDGTHIVKPYELSRERQLDLCSQCHSNASKRKTAPFSFRPGNPLTDHFRIDEGRYPEKNHTANHIHYLRQSKCFQGSDMTCVTCHSPHVPEGPDNSASAANSCFGCHQSDDCADRGNLPEPVRDRCLDCHMPREPAINIWFSLPDDDFVSLIERRRHRIGVYPDAKNRILLEWSKTGDDDDSRRLADQLTRDLFDERVRQGNRFRDDDRLIAAIGAYRDALRYRQSDEISQRLADATATLREFDAVRNEAAQHADRNDAEQAIALLQRAIKLKPNEAMAHGKLGLLLASNGREEEGLSHLKLESQLDPDSAYGTSLTGWIHYVRRRFEQSVAFYELAIEKDPYNAQIRYQFALTLGELRRLDEAATQLQRSFEIDPNQDEVIARLGDLLRQQGKPRPLIDLLEQSRSAPSNPAAQVRLLTTLAEAYADQGQTDPAIERLQSAIVIAEREMPEIAGQLKRRLSRLQTSP